MGSRILHVLTIIFVLCFFSVFANNVFARDDVVILKNKYVAKPNSKVVCSSIQLQKIKAVKTEERHGDELYLSITVYPSDKKPINYSIPEPPMHWLSRYLKEIKQLTLYKSTLKNGESASVVLTLIEKDAYPWNIDDLIGTVQVHIKNKDGKLYSVWHAVNSGEEPKVEKITKSQTKAFQLKPKKGLYVVKYELRVNPGMCPRKTH